MWTPWLVNTDGTPLGKQDILRVKLNFYIINVNTFIKILSSWAKRHILRYANSRILQDPSKNEFLPYWRNVQVNAILATFSAQPKQLLAPSKLIRNPLFRKNLARNAFRAMILLDIVLDLARFCSNIDLFCKKKTNFPQQLLYIWK